MTLVSPVQTAQGRILQAWYSLMALVLGVTLLFAPAATFAQDRTPADDLTDLRANLTTTMDALVSGDVAGAQDAFTAFDSGWDGIEDGIRAKDRDMYRAIESVIDEVKSALLRPESPDVDEAIAALQRLDAQIDAALPSLY